MLHIIEFVPILLNAILIAYLFISLLLSRNIAERIKESNEIKVRINGPAQQPNSGVTDTERLAEYILLCAARDSGGHCYPNQLKQSRDDINKALSLLGVYGTINENSKGPYPIFTINELGRELAANMTLE